MRVLFLILCLAMILPARAWAYDFEITTETVGQGYQLKAADDTLVNRRRLSQSLGLSLYNLGPRERDGRRGRKNQFYLTVLLRVDAELGDFAALKELSGRTPDRGVATDRLDILYAYVGGSDLFGVLDFRLGRQIMVDLFDFQSFDGLSVELKSPFHVSIEAWGGLNVTGAAPFDSPIYRADGIALSGNTLGSLAARQEDALQPTFGIAAKLYGFRDLMTRISYSRTMSFTQAQRPGEPNSGVVDEKVAWTTRGRLFSGKLIPWFGLRYNLLVGRLDEIQAGARFQMGGHGVQAEYVMSAPTFDGDSIWNVFATSPFNDARLSYDFMWKRVSSYARGFVRMFDQEQTSQSGAKPPTDLATSLAYGANAGARLGFSRGHVRLDTYYEDGFGGRKVGVDVASQVRVFGSGEMKLNDWGSAIWLDGRVSYVNFRDDLRPDDRADSFGVQGGGRWTFYRGMSLHLLVEENVNRIYSSQFRALAMFEVAYWLGPNGRGFTRMHGWSGM